MVHYHNTRDLLNANHAQGLVGPRACALAFSRSRGCDNGSCEGFMSYYSMISMFFQSPKHVFAFYIKNKNPCAKL